MHVLSTPPAFVLSQDQTLRKKLHAPCQRNKPTPCEFNLTTTNITTDVHIHCPKGITINPPQKRSERRDINNWHLTIKCTLLSSQGPDTTRTHPKKASEQQPVNLTTRVVEAQTKWPGYFLARLRRADKGIHYAGPTVRGNSRPSTGRVAPCCHTPPVILRERSDSQDPSVGFCDFAQNDGTAFCDFAQNDRGGFCDYAQNDRSARAV